MYTPSAFREDRLDVLLEAIADHPLATLVTAGAGGIRASHIPLVYSPGILRGHVAKANPHWKDAGEGEALAIFTGPQHYISPAWYAAKREHGKVVPTWNYIAVHVRGKLTLHTDASWLRKMLDDLTDAQERKLGTGWRVSDAPREFLDAQMAAIVGVEMTIEAIEGKWKLSQNRSAEDREGVIAGLEALGTGAARAMSRTMSGVDRANEHGRDVAGQRH